jgi:UDP-N-acetylglucosamine 2-epimerase (non-hydrolysing)
MKKKMDIVILAGTRPEIIKLADLIPLFNKYNHAFVYTGQHYSNNMKDIFFDELKVKPDYDLRCNTSDTNILKENIVKFLQDINPAYIIVYGDTNSSLAGSLAAKEIKSKLIHIEAGIRDFDLSVPEEKNRIKIDAMSDYLLCPTELCKTVLKYEERDENVFVTGNLIVDICRRLSRVADQYGRNDLPSEYILLTLHRPENVDDPIKLEMLRKHLKEVRQKVIFPIHPRTKKNLIKYNIKLSSNVIAIEPAGYIDFLYLLKNCKVVLTDSGGIQEEAIVLKKPCITLRHTSARWETILLKANILFPLDRKDSLNDVIDMMLPINITINPFGENVANTTLKVIDKFIS